MSLKEIFYSHPVMEKCFISRMNFLDRTLYSSSEKKICDIVKDDFRISLTNSPSVETCEKLYRIAEKSKVGKGKKTVLDEYTRKSREFGRKQIVWDADFVKDCRNLVKNMLKTMNAGFLISIRPHKLVIYGRDDFFLSHIDAVHKEGHNMSAVLELDTDYSTTVFSTLCVEDRKIVKNKGCSKLVIFDHDMYHKVKKIEKNYRVSITFDLVVKNVINAFDENEMKFMVDDVYKLGVQRFGFFCTHKYIGREQPLKGLDEIIVKYMKPFIKSYERIQLFTNGSWYHEDVWNFINTFQESDQIRHETYCSCGDSDCEDCQDIKEFELTEYMKSDFPVEWIPKKLQNYEHIIAPEYRLDDILCLWSPSKPSLFHIPNAEIFLGNNGLSATVETNTFIVFELK